MKVTVDIPDEYAERLPSIEHELPEIIGRRLRESDAHAASEYDGVAEILEQLAALPSPEEVLAMKASPYLQARISELLAKNRNEGLTADEDREWQRIEYAEHLVRIAKAKAMVKLKSQ